MRHELFIDNQKVDLSKNTSINLTYKSNLLSELDKITSSYSYTIKLPKTKRNMELIEGCSIVSNNSSFAYLPHRARLLRDGIEIVRDAVVVLLSVGSDIQISLTWGNVSALVTFLTSEQTLGNLDLGSIKWTTAITERTPSADYGNKGAFYQPVVSVTDIIEKIKQSRNLPIEIVGDKDGLNKYVIPVLNNKGNEGVMTRYEQNLIPFDRYGKFNDDSKFYGDGLDFEHPYFLYGGKWYEGNDKYSYTSIKFKTGEIYVQIEAELIGQSERIQGFDPTVPPKVDEAVFSIFNLEFKPDSYSVIDESHVEYYWKTKEPILINAADYIDYQEQYYMHPYDFEVPGGYYSYSGIVKYKITPVDLKEKNITPVLENVLLYLAPNMPDISQIDFLKGIMSMMGWYAEPMEGDSGIRMLPYSTITDNKSKAVDWSEKLVNRRIEPSDIEFRMSNMAQKNYFRYAEDDTVTGDYDSYISVDDKTLDASNDAVKLPFGATDTVNGVSSIPLYSFNEDGEMEINDSLTPRVLIQEGTSLKFDGLQWSKLIQANWGAYQEIIRRPKIITEQVRLNAIDLKQIDMTIPVYISQYGSYFAILEIKTKNDDICDVQLLKI